MDVALRLNELVSNYSWSEVLILVVMDVALRQLNMRLNSKFNWS